jgi:signal transduction histidine kinase
MTAGHYGIVVMQERAKRFGGKLNMESRPGEGTTVEAWIPLAGEGAVPA